MSLRQPDRRVRPEAIERRADLRRVRVRRPYRARRSRYRTSTMLREAAACAAAAESTEERRRAAGRGALQHRQRLARRELPDAASGANAACYTAIRRCSRRARVELQHSQ